MFSVEKLQTALQQLSKSIYSHEQWHNKLIQTIICQLPYDDSDVAEDAHRRCGFGQWYYGGDIDQELRDHPAFIASGVEHEHMHRFAAQLLHTSVNGRPVSSSDYDIFAKSLERLRLEIHSLQHEIEDSLHGHDPLTGTKNRIGMLSKLREELELVKRHIGQCCVAMMDLDYFKSINDTHGHLVGDKVLASSAYYVMEQLRPYDKVFRYGGEEFLILIPSTSLQAGQTVIERICKGLAAIAIAHDGGNPISVTASFGITLLDPDVSIEESIDRADNAMYAAKKAGRNRVCVWDSSITYDSTPQQTLAAQRD
jgi:diguanylate cyclase (GGDEF)-like protein